MVESPYIKPRSNWDPISPLYNPLRGVVLPWLMSGETLFGKARGFCCNFLQEATTEERSEGLYFLFLQISGLGMPASLVLAFAHEQSSSHR